MLRTLTELAPQANPEVLGVAAHAYACAQQLGAAPQDTVLGVIDFSLPSSAKRFWVFDLLNRQLLFEEWVAHGRNSGMAMAETFSNEPGSLKSSIGTFLTGEPYVGRNGYSLRLLGLDPGVNDKALDRAIVIHGASYVSEGFLRAQGRMGRSLGCPAVRADVAKPLIDAVKGGALIYAYEPDAEKSSATSDCSRRH